MQPSVTEQVRDALRELHQLAQCRPWFSQHIAVVSDTLPVLFDRCPRQELHLDPDTARSKLHDHVPLLRGIEVPIDQAGFRRRWLAIASALERHRQPAGNKIAELLRDGDLKPEPLVRLILAGNVEAVDEEARRLGVDTGLFMTVVRLALFPLLAGLAESLAPLVKRFDWTEGYCATCGSWPILSEFRGLEQIRFMRCGVCATEWDFPRLKCPYCMTSEHHHLGYLRVEGEKSKYRVATCDSCRGYVKAVSTVVALNPAQLLVADLATMHLDLVAAERGYRNRADR
jgi:FdhE protein